MINPYIYIDDSGSPGANIDNEFYLPSSKLYVALIVKESQKKKITDKINKLLTKTIKQYPEVKEFHFKDIYTGKREYKNMDIEYRTFIIEKFVSLYNEFRFPILIRVSSKKAIENSFYSPEVKCSKIDNFCLGNKDDFALMSVIGSCDRYLIKYKNSYGIKSEPRVIIDEGRQKAGSEQKLQFTTDKIRKVFYEKSDEEILLQLADFMAFTINRIQNNLVKDRTKFDQKFMEMVGKLHYNNVDNLIYIQAKKIHDYTKEKFNNDANKIKLVKDKDSKLAKEIQEYTNQLYKKVHNLEDKINRS